MLSKRSGMDFRGGRTWHQAAAATGYKLFPCYELEWDDDGKVTHTRRYALLSPGTCSASERLGEGNVEPNALHGERYLEHDEFVDLVFAVHYGENVPELQQR